MSITLPWPMTSVTSWPSRLSRVKGGSFLPIHCSFGEVAEARFAGMALRLKLRKVVSLRVESGAVFSCTFILRGVTFFSRSRRMESSWRWVSSFPSGVWYRVTWAWMDCWAINSKRVKMSLCMRMGLWILSMDESKVEVGRKTRHFCRFMTTPNLGY